MIDVTKIGSLTSVNLALRDCTVVGAAGYQVDAGRKVALVFLPDRIHIEQEDGTGFRIPLVEIASVEISGPGVVQSGGGFVGGGFGVAGAIEGMAISAVLNALTSKTKIYTFISVITNVGELHLHFQGMEPGALRVALSPLYVALRALDPDWVQGRRRVLDEMRSRDCLTEKQYEGLARRLGAASVQEEAPVPVGGRCPSCKSPVAISAERCHCGAMFVGTSLWRVEPIE